MLKNVIQLIHIKTLTITWLLKVWNLKIGWHWQFSCPLTFWNGPYVMWILVDILNSYCMCQLTENRGAKQSEPSEYKHKKTLNYATLTLCGYLRLTVHCTKECDKDVQLTSTTKKCATANKEPHSNTKHGMYSIRIHILISMETI